jgi:hypothetical protein
VGLFKDMGNKASGIAGMAASGQAAANAVQTGLTDGSFDPNDPAFAPIEGVDLKGYCKGVSAIQKAGAQTAEEAAKVGGETVGVSAEQWQAVSDGWVARMRQSRAVMNQYGVLYGTV